MTKKVIFSMFFAVIVFSCNTRPGSSSLKNFGAGANNLDSVESVLSLEGVENEQVISAFDTLDTFEGSKGSIIPKAISERVFYQVSQSDSGQYVFKSFHSGFSGFRIEENKYKSFGFESFVLDIDSVLDFEWGYQVFTSKCYLDIFEREQVDTFSFNLSFIEDKEGLLLYNQEWLFVDSVFLHESLIPVVEEEPYDINEAWANDPANQ